MTYEACISLACIGMGVIVLIAIAERLGVDLDDDDDFRGGAGGHAS